MRLRLGYLRDCSRRSPIIWRAKSTSPCVTLSEPSKELPNALSRAAPENCAVKGCAEPGQPVRDGTEPEAQRATGTDGPRAINPPGTPGTHLEDRSGNV